MKAVLHRALTFALLADVLAAPNSGDEDRRPHPIALEVMEVRRTGTMHLMEIRVLSFVAADGMYAIEASWSQPESCYVRDVAIQEDFSWLFHGGVVACFAGDFSMDGVTWEALPEERRGLPGLEERFVEPVLGRPNVPRSTGNGVIYDPQTRVIQGVAPTPMLVIDVGRFLDGVGVVAGPRWQENGGVVWMRLRVSVKEYVPWDPLSADASVPWRFITLESDEIRLSVPSQLVDLAVRAQLVNSGVRGSDD